MIHVCTACVSAANRNRQLQTQPTAPLEADLTAHDISKLNLKRLSPNELLANGHVVLLAASALFKLIVGIQANHRVLAFGEFNEKLDERMVR